MAIVSRSVKLSMGDYNMTEFFLSMEGERPVSELNTLVDREMLNLLWRVYRNKRQKVEKKDIIRKHGLAFALDKLPEDDIEGDEEFV